MSKGIAAGLKRVLLLSVGAGALGMPLGPVDHVEVVDYGLYTARVISARRDRSGIVESTVGDVRQARVTREVPAKLGVRFGYRFVAFGAHKGARVLLRAVTLYPAPGLAVPGAAAPLRRSYNDIVAIVGGPPVYRGYSFDNAWELVPGRWTFELWSGYHKLATQSFDVVGPAGRP